MKSLLDAARTGLAAEQVQETVNEYRDLHDESRGGDRVARSSQYEKMINQYYDLVTDFYEYGWGDSFHFAPRQRGESLRESILRHEHYLAMRLGLGPEMRVLDVGCGVGGPMRNITRFCGARIQGLNNNAYQIRRGEEHLGSAGMEESCSFIHGDFMKIPAEDATYDAAYAIEATCHAPDRAAAFSEISRVLKGGSLFGGYEWCLGPNFDADNPTHLAIKKGIEQGNALPTITPTSAVDRALVQAGFEVLDTQDLASDCGPALPWYLPLKGADLTLSGLGRTRIGRTMTNHAVRLLERLRLAPRGVTKVHSILNATADSLVEGGETGIFTPLYFFLARKPARS